MIYCVIWKKKDYHEMFSNYVFTTEKEAEEFAKKSKLKKKHDFRIVDYDYKYFNGVKLKDGNR
tara:strand:+ start:1815 stop:2003 length:189 start_codon:yes stop_codon:yes gene_type:complete